MKRYYIFILLIGFILHSNQASAQSNLISVNGSVYIHPELGNDANIGTKESPIRSLYEVARRVNLANGKGAITIYLSEGIYGLDKTVTFHPANWHFTKEERLTIRAEFLPDDTVWDPGKMPIIVSTMPLDFKPYGNQDPLGGASYGIQIETDHVTIQGFRVLGTPVHERPKNGMVRRNYPIVREGRSLNDLRVTQCLFVGDENVIPNHLGVLASGQGIVVDHCVFYQCKDAVVFWQSDKPAERCEMHHNLMIDNYGAAVWSWTVADDFKFYNNVISNNNVFWEVGKDENKTYTLTNSLVVGYNSLVNKGGGAFGYGEPTDPKRLKYGKDVIIKKEGSLQIEKDQTKRNYLHLIPGSLGSDLGAGLFYK